MFRVGCVIVNSNNRHSVVGYNGSPSGAPNCHEADCPKDDDGRCRGCHAEINAIRTAMELQTLSKTEQLM